MDDPILEKPTLPIWLNKGEIVKLATACHRWFLLLQSWAKWPLMQLDPLKCTEACLELIAYQRDIDRFKDEPLYLYRLRVAYAYINARDAGSVVGFKRIFSRLGIGYVEIEERMDGMDWDIIHLTMSNTQLAENSLLLDTLIQHYGRTCRRYGWKIVTPLPVELQIVEFSNETITSLATLEV
ncbi:MAG: phage tail protein [Desulfotalea sp.]